MGPTEIASRISVWVGQAKRTISSHLPFLPFIVLSTWIFVVLARVFLLRLSYPLDLEWMEGGILTHALRLGRGQPLYAEPSVDFVSFLYTPLYPAVLCVLSKIFGLSYMLGRAVSILAFSGALVFLVAAVRGIAQQFESEELPAVATTAGLLGAAAVCLAFPFCGAFYDLVRCDSLWLFFVSAGLYSCSPGRSMTRIVLGALLLVLGFFTKQTAAPFMVAAAASVALTSGIKRGLVFSAVAFGSTTTAILVGQYLTDGWLWIYIYRLHQSHETLFERIWPETPVSCSTTGSCSWFPSPRASCSWPSGAGCLEGSSIGHPWRPRVLRQRPWAAQLREPTTTRTFRPSTSERFCLRRVPSSSQRSPQGSGPRLTGLSGPLESATDPGSDRCGSSVFLAWGYFQPTP